MDDRVWDFIDDALANAGDISGLDPVLESYGLLMVRVFDTNDDAFIENSTTPRRTPAWPRSRCPGSAIRAGRTSAHTDPQSLGRGVGEHASPSRRRIDGVSSAPLVQQ